MEEIKKCEHCGNYYKATEEKWVEATIGNLKYGSTVRYKKHGDNSTIFNVEYVGRTGVVIRNEESESFAYLSELEIKKK
jgi:hypothetical protein